METMVTTLVLEEIVARQRCKGCMIITEGGRMDHILPKMQIKPQMSRAGWGKWIRKMELKKSHRCEGATTGRQTHTFEHLAVKKTPSRVFAL